MSKEKISYPHFLSIKPYGEDFFDGKSQERIKNAIAEHIKQVDSMCFDVDNKDLKSMVSRIIGIEGPWGSGKSNVIELLKKSMKLEHYIFFTYDAWGNQEDLQRRTILELLTQQLIKDNVLRGKALLPSYKIKQIKDEEIGKLQPSTWNDKLESLHTHRSNIKEITIPSINNSTKWFVLVLLITGFLIPFMDMLKPDHVLYWYRCLSIFVCLIPIIIFSLCMFKNNDKDNKNKSYKASWKENWKEMFNMYETGGKTETVSSVISEGEPTISEFKTWMNEISLSLEKGNKLVVIFDNMDRLPTEKVRQLWSLIYTFFADDGYDNIWCIIPFDETHLAETFGKNNDGVHNEQLRQFLHKTFPVIYRISEPIITDYKGIVNTLLKDAFGETLDEIVLEKINQLYRIANPTSVVREVISFINKMVSLKHEWNDELNILSIAIYVLQEDNILKHPHLLRKDKDNKEIETEVSTEEYIISKGYETFFELELSGENHDEIRKDIAALVYNVTPENADQIVVKMGIKSCLSSDKGSNLESYMEYPHFISILEEVVKELPANNFSQMSDHISKIDERKLNKDDKKRLSNLWTYIGKIYIEKKSLSNKPYNFEWILFSHVDSSMQLVCAKVFYNKIITSENISGSEIYIVLKTLFNNPYAKNWEINQICTEQKLEIEKFLEYIHEAGINYNKFPFYVDNKKLNEYIISNLNGSFPYLEEVKLLKDDPKYNLSTLVNTAVTKLSQQKVGAKEAGELIRLQRIFFPKFQNQDLGQQYITTLWNEVKAHTEEPYYGEIYTLKFFTFPPSPFPSDTTHINMLKEKVMFYKSTEELFVLFPKHSTSLYFKNLIAVCIKEQIHDENPSFEKFISIWGTINRATGVTYKELVSFADSWGYNVISDAERRESIKTLLNDPKWVSDIKVCDTQLSHELINKAINELTSKKIEEFVNGFSHINSYWDKLLQELISSNLINSDNMGELKNLVIYLLDYIAKNDTTNDDIWNALIDRCEYGSISTEVVVIRDNILIAKQGYIMTPSKFYKLHVWLEKSGINEPLHLADAANKIMVKIIDDEQSQKIIMCNADYYRPILAVAQKKSSILYEKMRCILNTDTDFAKYLESIM